MLFDKSGGEIKEDANEAKKNVFSMSEISFGSCGVTVHSPLSQQHNNRLSVQRYIIDTDCIERKDSNITYMSLLLYIRFHNEKDLERRSLLLFVAIFIPRVLLCCAIRVLENLFSRLRLSPRRLAMFRVRTMG